jgi:hypothetical protein
MGAPEEIVAAPNSYTGQFLEPLLAKREQPKRATRSRQKVAAG